jgi:hypothetical protein
VGLYFCPESYDIMKRYSLYNSYPYRKPERNSYIKNNKRYKMNF